MKDYTLGSNNKFILKYEKENDEIIIYYANGNIYKNKYTKELEKDLLEQMKRQISNVDINKLTADRITKKIAEYIVSFILTACIILGNIIGFYNISLIPLIVIASLPIAFTKSIDNTRKKRIDDYYKNKSFIENIELFQTGLKDDMGTYLNLDRKTRKTLKKLVELKNNQEKQEEYQILNEPTINTIDSISIDSYYQIKELLKENEEYSKYYTKKKVLKKEN